MKTVLIISLAIAIAAGIIFWLHAGVVLDKTAAFEKRTSSLFSRFGITEESLTKMSLKEKRLGMKRYVSVYKEYAVPATFAYKNFEASLKAALKTTPFKLTGSAYVSTKKIESNTLEISFGRFDVFTLKVNRKKGVVLPSTIKKFKNPKVAIVMDDFGYNMNDLETLFGIRQPLTLAILPNLRYSQQIARLARSRGYEVILHLPLEPHRKDVKEEVNTIKSGMGANDITSRLEKDLSSVPGLKGVSNHMGSKATEDRELMTVIFRYLKKHNLYFFDSLTSEKSVCRKLAAAVGLKYARRDIFLDIPNKPEYVEKQLAELKETAFRKGCVIAVCHDRKNTIMALSKTMPDMAHEGIEFVYLSELIK